MTCRSCSRRYLSASWSESDLSQTRSSLKSDWKFLKWKSCKFFLDKIKQEVAECCPLNYFISRNSQTSSTEKCSKLVILFVVPMGILMSFRRYLTYPAIWTMLDLASTLSEDFNVGNWSKRSDSAWLRRTHTRSIGDCLDCMNQPAHCSNLFEV